ncbi:hypothetical protein MRX96_023162 [Rhipicephalus microplus]
MADQEEEAKAKKEVRVFGRPELASKVAMFQRKAEDHDRKQKDNPFSERWDGSASSALSKDDPRYGHPEEGSKTEKRGQQAGQLISSEVRVLCENVHEFGTEQPDGTRAITFGELFQLYTSISNKRRDDGVVIRLLRPIAEIHAEMGYNSALAQLPKTTPVLLGGKTAPS